MTIFKRIIALQDYLFIKPNGKVKAQRSFPPSMSMQLKAAVILPFSDFKEVDWVNKPFFVVFALVRVIVGLLDVATRLCIVPPCLFFFLLRKAVMLLRKAVMRLYLLKYSDQFTRKEDLSNSPEVTEPGALTCILITIITVIPLSLLEVSFHTTYCLMYATVTLLQHVFEFTCNPLPLVRQLWGKCESKANKAGSVVTLSLLFLALTLALLTVSGTLPFIPATWVWVLLPALPLWQAVLFSVVAAYIVTVAITNIIMSFNQHIGAMRKMELAAVSAYNVKRNPITALIMTCDAFFSYPSVELAANIMYHEKKQPEQRQLR